MRTGFDQIHDIGSGSSYHTIKNSAPHNQSVRHGFELFYLNNIDGRCSR